MTSNAVIFRDENHARFLRGHALDLFGWVAHIRWMDDITDKIWFPDLTMLGRRIVYEPGQILRHAGAMDSTADFLIAGNAEVWHVTADGREAWLGALEAGDIFGSALLSPGNAEHFDIVAYSQTTLFRLRAPSIAELAVRHPSLSADLAAHFAKALRDTQWASLYARILSAPRRVEAELLRLSRCLDGDPERRVIRPNPVLSDIARRADTTRETASRVVSALCRAGFVERCPGALVLQRAEALRDQVLSSV